MTFVGQAAAAATYVSAYVFDLKSRVFCLESRVFSWHPLEFQNDDVIQCLHAKCTKLSLETPALVLLTPKLNI